MEIRNIRGIYIIQINPELGIMKKIVNIIIIIIVFLNSSLMADELVNLFLPAESLALGESFSVSSRGANGCWLNPAGLNGSPVNQYSIGGARWTGDLNLFLGSAVVPFSFGNLGFGVGWLGKESVLFEDETGVVTGQKLKFDNLLLSVGYGTVLYNIPAGVSLKFINSTLGLDEEQLVLADIGTLYRLNEIDLGFMIRSFEMTSSDPFNWGELRLNAGWQAISQRMIGLYILGDIFYSAENSLGFDAGAEVELFKIAALRLGFAPYRYNQIQLGAGFKINISTWNLKIDYGLNPAIEGLQTSHFAQVTFRHAETIKKSPKIKKEKQVKPAEKIIKTPAKSNSEEIIKQGITCYKKENFQEAINIWEEVPSTDADYKKVQAYIKRAEFRINEQEQIKKTEELKATTESTTNDDKMRLAILDLEPQNVPLSTAALITDILQTELFNTGLFKIMERGEISSILKEQELQVSGCTETECAVQIGRLLSARKILIGSIGKIGKIYIINVRIVDVEKGEMEFAEKIETDSEDDLTDAAAELAEELAERIE